MRIVAGVAAGFGLAAVACSEPVMIPIALAQERWAGVKWTPPPGMKEIDYGDSHCPGYCTVYEGEEDSWPRLILHAPIIGPADEAPQRYRDDVASRTGDTLHLDNSQKAQERGFNITMNAIEQRGKRDDPGDGDFSIISFIAKGDVTLPVELRALSKRRLEGRIPQFAALAESVSIDDAAASASAKAGENAIQMAIKAVEAGYARGEKAEMYLYVDAGVRNEYKLGGMQLVAYRNEDRLLFLPGGIFVEDGNIKDFRKPDIAALTAQDRLGTWQRSGGNYAVTLNGETTIYGPGRTRGEQKTLVAQGTKRELDEIAHITAADLVGSYATINSSMSGGGSSGMATVASRSDSKLKLLPDGRFEMTRKGWAGVLSSSVTVSTNSDNDVKGTYEWDPLSWMLTLKAEDGTVTRGPMVPGPGQFTAAARKKGGDWNVLGNTKWWREE